MQLWTLEVVETLCRAEVDGVSFDKQRIRWATEVTVHDTLQMKDHLKEVHKAGCVPKTIEPFNRLRDAGICPMPMHHDSQPLYSHGSHYGLLNQVRLLRKAGAVTLKVIADPCRDFAAAGY